MKKSFGRSMSILHRHSQVYFNCSLKEFGITSAEYSFLLYLYRNNGVTQDELSSYLYIDKAATARAVQSLEQKGYITKVKDPADKRCNRIFITDKAKAREEEIWRRIRRWGEYLTEGIDEATIETVTDVLEKMIEKIEDINFIKILEESQYGTCKPFGRRKDT